MNDPKCNRFGGGGDTVFSGTILELLPAAANRGGSGGGRPGVVRGRTVYKGGGNSIDLFARKIAPIWVRKKTPFISMVTALQTCGNQCKD